MPTGHHYKPSLRFKFAMAAEPAGGAHSGPPDLLAGSRERTPKGRGGRGRKMKGRDKGGEGNVYDLPWKKILRASNNWSHGFYGPSYIADT